MSVVCILFDEFVASLFDHLFLILILFNFIGCFLVKKNRIENYKKIVYELIMATTTTLIDINGMMGGHFLI